jgi:hypothetical protein
VDVGKVIYDNAIAVVVVNNSCDVEINVVAIIDPMTAVKIMIELDLQFLLLSLLLLLLML